MRRVTASAHRWAGRRETLAWSWAAAGGRQVVEDLDLRLDDEHVRSCGKGGSVRTVLLDDRGHVALRKLYLARAGCTAGPLFRASINGRGGPLSYDAAHHRRQIYCAQAGAEIDIHQLRHAHATELINAGVSIEAVRDGCGRRRYAGSASPSPSAPSGRYSSITWRSEEMR
ncbi:tyrosine-type recombinase/integrase [Nonomuraea angiospora]|uniref:Integrase n=1 Tax=Nonomuraea angiospora TaxID=46172 RepID=A0ABR9M2V5_9ACTN|nr:tyrosine-type recombinase/integrase [Nonomuraea angiospora]MBE1586661.1 integrase [Nonomuraea angiospora]